MTIEGFSGTRSSDRWSTRPAKMDSLNTWLIFESVGDYGIPVLAPTDFVPTSLAAWHDPKQRREAEEMTTCQRLDTSTGCVKTFTQPKGALHFFIDDYRFEKVWSRPEATYERVAQVGAALSPDFSMWRDTPRAMQIWQLYRSHWCGVFWQHLGVEVIPTAKWSDESSYSFCFDGLPKNSTLALSAVGVRKDGRAFFLNGLKELISRCEPSMLLCYGNLPSEAREIIGTDCGIKVYPTHWDLRR